MNITKLRDTAASPEDVYMTIRIEQIHMQRRHLRKENLDHFFLDAINVKLSFDK